MKIRFKILLLLILGALVPLLLSHFFAVKMVTASMGKLINANLSHASEQAADRVNDWADRLIVDFSSIVDAVPFESFPSKDLHRALEIPYRQLPGATIVALLDDNGKSIVPPYRKPASEAEALGREPVADEDLGIFAGNVPFNLALTAEVALGPCYLSVSGGPRMVIARSFRPGGSEKPWILAVEISLASICSLIAAQELPGARRAAVLDLRGRSICEPVDGGPRAPGPNPDSGQYRRMAAGKAVSYKNRDGKPVIGAGTDVELTGWRLILEQPEALAMEPAVRSLQWTAIWILISLGIVFGGGLVLSRGLTQPIARLEEAATGIANGDYDRVLDIKSRDEVGNLARAFNRMAAEIKAWNTELKVRVEERTKELREAREQILRTQKLAAVGELGAGAAHEINNPLTGVVGIAQLLQLKVEPGSEVGKGLEDILENSRRVADVVNSLLRVSQSQVAAEMSRINGGELVKSSLQMFAARLEERGIEVASDIEDKCWIHGVDADLRLALNHLVENALRAMGDGGRLGVEVGRMEGGAVRIAIFDTGVGMSEETLSRVFEPFYTTNPPGSDARGLGLSLVHRVVSEHDGKIMVDSAVDRGTTVKIYLPGAAELSRR